MQGPASDRHILDWDETDVHKWLSSLGYPQYESQIRGMNAFSIQFISLSNVLTRLEHKIQGDSLCELDSEGLKSLGIITIGQRLSILRSIYQVKVAHNVPIDETHYIPPCLSTVSFQLGGH